MNRRDWTVCCSSECFTALTLPLLVVKATLAMPLHSVELVSSVTTIAASEFLAN